MAAGGLAENRDSRALAPVGASSQLNALRSEVWLTIQTRHAQQLLRGRSGRGRPRIAGLFTFADRLRVISQAAANDDPYADWWLIKVDQSTDAADLTIDQFLDELKDVFGDLENLRVVPVKSKNVVRVRLQFAVPSAYRGAALLAKFDRFARDLLTAQHVGLIEKAQVAERLFRAGRRVRASFCLPSAYRKSGLNRQAYLLETPASERAKSFMGPLPMDVLLGERRSAWAPPLAPGQINPASTQAADGETGAASLEESR